MGAVGEDGCRWCGDRRDETAYGLRVWSGRVTDAYFARRSFVRGYAIVVWRGRHVSEPIDLSPVESDLYHREVLTVARAIRDCFRPSRLNYLTLGNHEPHLHTHVTARYPDDPGAGGLLPPHAPPLLDEESWRADAAALKTLLT
ncbi:HIT domain-containing protein [Actinoplanes sp. NPDC023801]|uniref:HIT family protein n=1 Tax=Actinoplanes sp. NPDC023801 TaxID=3154595 RepID=UPI0033C450A5